MYDIKRFSNNWANSSREGWWCSFITKPEAIEGLAGLSWMCFLMGAKITLVKKRTQSNLDLIGANEINMQSNETNIVNQFEHKIKFSWLVPSEILCYSVVRICTNKVNMIIKKVHLSYTDSVQSNLKGEMGFVQEN